MNFNSFVYILIFLPVAALAFRLAKCLPVAKAPQVILLVASLTFYAWNKPFSLIYLAGSITVNWAIAVWISSSSDSTRKRILQLGLALNIGFLCAFKYLDFLINNISHFLRTPIHPLGMGFPLGISFFTLAQIMYLVDCYELLVPASSLFDHATFVSFFPYVISGPISRARRILHQFPVVNGHNGPAADMVARGIYLFSLGLMKKVVLADSFARAADYGFQNVAGLSAAEAWCFVTSYALQLYFDFSGYTDMAVASAMLFGIEIPRNFDAPLRSRSIIEFWQRWHITLSGFITTYLYTPILRSFRRATLLTAACATLISMGIAGLWHGANWTFVIFGVIHGIGLAGNQYWRKMKLPKPPAWLGWLLTFTIVDLAFVFFRAPDMHTAILYLSRLVDWHKPGNIPDFHDIDGGGLMIVIFSLSQAAGVIAAFTGKTSDQLAHEFVPSRKTYAVAVACSLLAFLYLNSNIGKPFVYFGF